MAKALILAAIFLLVLLLAAVHAQGCSSCRLGAAHFMPGDASTPKLREAVALVRGDLARIARLARGLEAGGLRIEAGYGPVDMGAAFNEARLVLAEARRGAERAVGDARGLRASQTALPPTYQNALTLFQELRGGDGSLWGTARGLDLAAARMQALVSSTDGHAHTAQAHFHALKLELTSAALLLRELATCFYALARSAHHLGEALELE
jgi:hypothetical protein